MAERAKPPVTEWLALGVWLCVAAFLMTGGNPIGWVRSRFGAPTQAPAAAGETFVGDGLADALRNMEG